MSILYACIQTNSIDNMQHNIDAACSLIAQAADQGADVVALPENVAYMSRSFEDLQAHAYLQDEHPALDAFKKSACAHRIWIIIGSLAMQVKGRKRLANRSFVISPQGDVTASYDKIHLYDVQVAKGESHQESKHFFPGSTSTITPIADLQTGLTICYDLRFPYLYQSLAKQGAQVITVPAAFTHHTGMAHWEVLLRARAIEAQCYIIAPAQCGHHPNNRRTYGHSMIIDPWGTVLSQASADAPCVITAPVSASLITDIRKQLPSLANSKEELFQTA